MIFNEQKSEKDMQIMWVKKKVRSPATFYLNYYFFDPYHFASAEITDEPVNRHNFPDCVDDFNVETISPINISHDLLLRRGDWHNSFIFYATTSLSFLICPELKNNIDQDCPLVL